LVHAIKVALESVYVLGPETAEGSEPGVHLLKGFGLEAIEATLGIHSGFDETGVAENAKVLGDGGLRHVKLALNLADGVLRGEQKAQDGAAIGLGDDFESGFHGTNILQRVYTCQGIYESEIRAAIRPNSAATVSSPFGFLR
jgi:hypothetical protein